jgi:hypothetical protein
MEVIMQRGTLAILAFAFPVVLTATTAHARDCSGYNTHVLISAEVTEPAKGHSLMTFRNHDMLVTNDPKHILNMAMGECAGTMLTTPDGKMAGAGYCLRRDNDGDTQSIDWIWPKGAERGTWKSTGGTGKFAGLEGGGTWAQVASDGGKMGINRWDGTCNR